MGVTQYEATNLVVRSGDSDIIYPLKAGETVKIGDVLKLDTDKLVKAAAADTPHSIATEDVTATADTQIRYFLNGTYNQSGIENWDDAFREKLRAVGITIVKGV